MQVCNLTTPAQYFHALRRQMKRDFFKPLVLMTPKSLLTHPECVSRIEEFAEGTSFQEVLDDTASERGPEDRISRLIFCTGKVYYDLLDYRRKHEIGGAAIIRLEQIYPFHADKVSEIAGRYPNATKWVWCQEEPLNMGAWTFVGPRLQKLSELRVRYAGRDTASSPSSGAKTIHKKEQYRLLDEAFSK
jgi:2-oxoglutarate dehydrogenase E1 component